MKTYPTTNTEATLTELECERRFPWIPWRDPEKITLMPSGRTNDFLCRFCAAMYGFPASRFDELPQSWAEFHEHMTIHLERLKQAAKKLPVVPWTGNPGEMIQ